MEEGETGMTEEKRNKASHLLQNPKINQDNICINKLLVLFHKTW